MATEDQQPAEELAVYLDALDGADAPLLGHMVLYSVIETRVTPDQLANWFRELALDAAYLPAPLRAVDAFEKVTGPAGVKHTYPLDDLHAAGAGKRRRRKQDGKGREATLMIRHVRRDNDQIVRHLVREVRDEASVKLSYDVRLGECVFRRDQNPAAEHGAGALIVTPDHAAIKQLPTGEQDKVGEVLAEIRTAYQHNCAFYTSDRLRAVIRAYVEGLNAIRIRPTGGVYFVHREHAATLTALRELVGRFSGRSRLSRVPIPDQDEMREMVIAEFTTRARDELSKLAGDIAAAQRDNASEATVNALYKRFQSLQAAAAHHAERLNTSLDDTTAALQLVNAQLASLLAGAAS